MRVPLVIEEHAGIAREREPVSVGLPLARGAVSRGAALRLVDADGAPVPAQTRPLGWWSDGSIKWVLVDCLASVPARGTLELWLERAEAPVEPDGDALRIGQTMTEVTLATGVLEATLPRTGDALLSALSSAGEPIVDEETGVRLRVLDEAGGTHDLSLTSVDLSAGGPLRATVTLRGPVGPVLVAEARVSAYAGRGLLRLDVTLRNPRPAEHQDGLWDLGDPGSLLVEDASLVARLAAGEAAPRCLLSERVGEPLEPMPAGPVELYQDSSGGERWDASTHVTRDGTQPCSFRGYRVVTAEGTRRGERASPTLWLGSGERGIALSIRELWQCFPKALEASGRELRARLWPGQFAALHELQGGEQKTHTIWLSVEEPARPLDWAEHPLVARSTPEHYVATGVFPHLVAWDEDGDERLLELARLVVDEEQGFAARRELIDEYGFRNYGDVYADHEAVRHEGPEPLVSHYNNQYDGCYAALAQFARSGDHRFFELADAMARHIADVDVYHTMQDRPAYNRGPFWHTDHYTDAYTSTHRCYSRGSPQAQAGGYGGGPSNEHDYVAGLATHYLMTGWPHSKVAACGIGDWVIDQDDGDLTRLGKVLPGPTGLSTRTVDAHYHGPGRGSGNSVHTLVDVFELTGNERYLRTAEAFIRRVIHPDDDRDALGLVRDPENRWSYTVLLQAILHYLEAKAEAEELDQRYAYARETALAYARWMVDNERLSSEMKDRLLIWTETWPCQDVRKGLVLMASARHVEDPEERRRMHARGAELFDAAVDEILGWETRKKARPLVLMMRYGFEGSRLRRDGPDAHPMPRGPALEERGRPTWFVPWKALPAYLREEARKRLSGLRG